MKIVKGYTSYSRFLFYYNVTSKAPSSASYTDARKQKKTYRQINNIKMQCNKSQHNVKYSKVERAVL